jgi:hypothetical protein
MSAIAAPGAPAAPVATGPDAGRVSAGEACPLCGTPLAPTQEWCLHCGAAARTRLAAAPNWKAPIAVLATVALLALAAIAASVVKLAGDTGPAPLPIIRTVTTPAAAAAIAPTTTAPSATLGAPAKSGAVGGTVVPRTLGTHGRTVSPSGVHLPFAPTIHVTHKAVAPRPTPSLPGGKPLPKSVKIKVPEFGVPGANSEPGASGTHVK